MMTKSIRNKMYMNIVMLVFLLLTGVAVTLLNQKKADDMSNHKAQGIQEKPE